MGKRAYEPADSSVILPRETAEEHTAPRQLSEAEHQAIVADRVDRETAALKAEVETLKTEKAELESKLDVAETARQTAEDAKTAAEQELADFKAAQVREAELAELAGKRKTEVANAAKHLKDDFYTEARMKRWAAMSEDDFSEYVREMAAVSGAPVPAKDGEPPRETAMRGHDVTPKTEGRGAAKTLLSTRRGA